MGDAAGWWAATGAAERPSSALAGSGAELARHLC